MENVPRAGNLKHGMSPAGPTTRFIDLAGQRFGRLTVLAYESKRWICRCDCGVERSVVRTSLVKGRTRSCGCLSRELASARTSGQLVGQRFERLLVRSRATIGYQRRVTWNCTCDCGKKVVATTDALTSGHTKSCGCIRIARLQGKRFGRLLVRELVFVAGKPRWSCACDCGNEHVTSTNALRFRVRSCGCSHQDVAGGGGHPVHGHTGLKGTEYTAWTGMKQRCLNPRSVSYAHYGGRGIKVCDRWRESFLSFLEDVGPRPSHDHSIDRFPDANGNYEPGNVRWATRIEQASNKRLSAERVAVILDGLKSASVDLLERAIIDRVRVALLGA